ncbi:MAG: class I SAM-dependent methyltransferase [Planctomycetota bacterium]|nr:class I SAM-dependent methyltransferase [Planctomycetota bacterium]
MSIHESNSVFANFAEAAALHALEQYKVRLDDDSIPAIDLILKSESKTCDKDARSSLVLCYGAWLGQWLVRNLGGSWVGLHEPVPERLLCNHTTPSLESLISDLLKQHQDRTTDGKIAREKNRIAWDAMNADERFVRTDDFPTDRQQAIESLDPWLRTEFDFAQSLEPKHVLCLAAGGGTHGPLLAMAGAMVTVVDLSAKQLQIDQAVANQLGVSLKTIQASIDNLSLLATKSFDIVIQPVSMCYISDITRVYQEVARVLRAQGLYIAQHKQTAAMQADIHWREGFGYVIAKPIEDGQIAPEVSDRSAFREQGTTEYIHSMGTLLGGLCQSGFVIEDFSEPLRGDAWAPINTIGHRSRFLPPYIKVKARRRS